MEKKEKERESLEKFTFGMRLLRVREREEVSHVPTVSFCLPNDLSLYINCTKEAEKWSEKETWL